MPQQFVIRHIKSGKFLPEGIGSKGRGFTRVEPTDIQDAWPRRFHTREAAKIALTWWLKGEISVQKIRDSYGDWDERWHTVQRPDRKPDEYEVVEVDDIRLTFRDEDAPRNIFYNIHFASGPVSPNSPIATCTATTP